MIKQKFKKKLIDYNLFKFYQSIIRFFNKQKNPFSNLPIIDINEFIFEEKPISFYKINNQKEFISYTNSMANTHKKRNQIEEFLISKQTPLLIRVFDPIFNRNSQLYFGYENSIMDESGKKIPNIRESLLNTEYLLNSRSRATVLVLNHLLPILNNAKKKVYITEQVTSIFSFFELFYDNIIGSEYLGKGYISGQIVNGIRHEDLTNLSFKNEKFDILISLEVLEHIPNYEQAISEIYRVLAPGGIAIITVPFDTSKYEIIKRALISENGDIEHLLPPDYHGDPMKNEGILCFQYFGWELFDILKNTGFSSTSAIFTWSLEYGILGNDIMVIYAKK